MFLSFTTHRSFLNSVPPFLALLVAAGLVSSVAAPVRADFNYPDFSSANGLTLNGDATPTLTTLRLTQPEEGQAGSAWYTAAKQHVVDGFDTTFTFVLDGPFGSSGADGFAFLIQNEGETALGGGGSDLGYAGITRSLAVEFDTFGFDPETDNHVSVQSLGNAGNSAEDADSLGLAEAAVDMNDGNPHTVRIHYVPGTLSVYLDSTTDPLLVVSVDLQNILGDDILDENGDAWVGFTGATGGLYQSHDILNWTFSDSAGGTGCNCQNAIPISGVAFFDDSTIGAADCDGSSCADSSPARVYAYTSLDYGLGLVNTCSGADFDTTISVYTGCPMTADNEVACDHTNCGSGTQVTFCAIQGQTYYIRVGGVNGASGDFTLLAIVLASSISEGPFQNPANGHWYYTTTTTPWGGGEQLAQTKGGHLVTINDAAENAWVRSLSQFGGLFIGLNDVAVEGTFVWTSGEPVTYTNWDVGEPSNGGGVEDYAIMEENGKWLDQDECTGSSGAGAVIEVTSITLPGIIAGPFHNAATCHDYYLTGPGTWIEDEMKAQAVGGHLVSINNAAENEYVRANFANYNNVPQSVWIGLTDRVTEGTFAWTDGSPLTYTNWEPGEPNNLGNEDYVLMVNSETGTWNDAHSGEALSGVVEVPSFNCQPGDMNCSGSININDIPLFVQALLGGPGFGGCNANLADVNGDMLVNGRDVRAFLAAILTP